MKQYSCVSKLFLNVLIPLHIRHIHRRKKLIILTTWREHTPAHVTDNVSLPQNLDEAEFHFQCLAIPSVLIRSKHIHLYYVSASA